MASQVSTSSISYPSAHVSRVNESLNRLTEICLVLRPSRPAEEVARPLANANEPTGLAGPVINGELKSYTISFWRWLRPMQNKG